MLLAGPPVEASVDGFVNVGAGAKDDQSASLKMTVIRKEVAASEVVVLTVAAQDGSRLPDWAPGAHIDLILPDGVIRQYSLCGDRWDTSVYRLAILRKEDGRGGSVYVHDHLRVGDDVDVRGPRNNFHLVPSPRYLFIAGGIGITPLLPMLHQAEMLKTDWQLLYGGRSRQSMAFQDELARYGDRVHVVPQDERGLLDLDAWLGSAQERTKVYCCGSASLVDEVEHVCAVWPAHSLRTERFVPRKQPVSACSSSFEVVLARTGSTVTVQPGTSILETVRTAGVNVLSSCQEGICGTCETTVLAGFPDHRDSVLTDYDRESGNCMLICVSRSRSDQLILDL
jgi:ferredoxin-NADP reductase